MAFSTAADIFSPLSTAIKAALWPLSRCVETVFSTADLLMSASAPSIISLTLHSADWPVVIFSDTLWPASTLSTATVVLLAFSTITMPWIPLRKVTPRLSSVAFATETSPSRTPPAT